MDIGHIPGRYENSSIKCVGLLTTIRKLIILPGFIFLISGDNDKLELVKDLESLSIAHYFLFQFKEQLVGWIILNSNERMGNIHEQNGSYSFDDVSEEKIDGASGKVRQCQESSFFMGEDAELILRFDGEVLNDFSNFKCIFINILCIIKQQRTQSL